MKRFVNIKSMATIAMIALFSVSVVAMTPDKKKKKRAAIEQVEESPATPPPSTKEDYGNTVTLVTSGKGATEDEATRVALRSAIEQAFGTFVSANTSVVNDELVKDEIVTVSSGNVVGYNLISKVSTSDGGCQVSIQSTVSIGKLVAFAQNHGMSAELSGRTFLHNRNLALLNRKNEMEALNNLTVQLALIAEQGLYDFSVEVGQPHIEKNYSRIEKVLGKGKVSSSYNFYNVGVKINATPNDNFKLFWETIRKTLESLSMSKDEIANYQQLDFEHHSYAYSFSFESDNKIRSDTWREYYPTTYRASFYRLRTDIGKLTADSRGDNPSVGDTWFLQNVDMFLKTSKYSYEIYDNLGTVISPFLSCNLLVAINNKAQFANDHIWSYFVRRNDQLPENFGIDSGYGFPVNTYKDGHYRQFPIVFTCRNTQLSLSTPFTDVSQLFRLDDFYRGRYTYKGHMAIGDEIYSDYKVDGRYTEKIELHYNEAMLSNLREISIRPRPLQILPQHQGGVILTIMKERAKRK